MTSICGRLFSCCRTDDVFPDPDEASPTLSGLQYSFPPGDTISPMNFDSKAAISVSPSHASSDPGTPVGRPIDPSRVTRGVPQVSPRNIPTVKSNYLQLPENGYPPHGFLQLSAGTYSY